MRAHTGHWPVVTGRTDERSPRSATVMSGAAGQRELPELEQGPAALRTQLRRYNTFLACSSLHDLLHLPGWRPRRSRHADKPVRPAVVVGVDGSVKSLAATSWAAREAELRGLPLRLVYAIDPTDAAAALPADPARNHQVAQKALDEAAAEAQKVCEGITLETLIVDGPPAQALVRDGAPATMICVGASGPTAPHPGHRASVVTEIIVAADCPVTVFRHEPEYRGWVVAEITGEPGSADVLRIAMEEAVLHQLPLRIVTGPGGAAHGNEASRAELRERIERSLDHWRQRHPDLDAITVATSWNLHQYLRRYTDNIALFVAPPRQIHDIGTILHPTAIEALTALHCPVTLCGSCNTRVGPDLDWGPPTA